MSNSLSKLIKEEEQPKNNLAGIQLKLLNLCIPPSLLRENIFLFLLRTLLKAFSQ